MGENGEELHIILQWGAWGGKWVNFLVALDEQEKEEEEEGEHEVVTEEEEIKKQEIIYTKEKEEEHEEFKLIYILIL